MPRHEVMFVGIGLLILLLGVPLAQRRVRPNRWYGLRLPATFADKSVWYDANAATGRDMIVLGAVFTTFALLIAWLPGVSDVTYAVTCGAALVGASVVLTVRGIRLANRLHRERGARPHPDDHHQET
jgi:uncharacterized membrane protein